MVISGRKYVSLSERVLLTDHAEKELWLRYGDFPTSLQRFCKELEKLTPTTKQQCVTVGGYKLVIEWMSRDGKRCVTGDDCYLVIVTVLSPHMKWRGDRSRRVRELA